MAYNLAQATEVKKVSSDSVQLNYGSAHLKGYLYEDKMCIDPIGNRCAGGFEFLALYDAKGLSSDIDGILGLANHKDSKKRHLNYVWALKDQDVIKEPIVSFSVTPDDSYALFGDWNKS